MRRIYTDGRTVPADAVRMRSYQRLPKTMPAEATACTEYDRSVDPASGEERFDLTPPAGLPPPPPR